MMKIAVVGATGPTGIHLVTDASAMLSKKTGSIIEDVVCAGATSMYAVVMTRAPRLFANWMPYCATVQCLGQNQILCPGVLAKLAMLAVLACINSGGLAQDFDAGKSEYQSSCEACHGQDGKGKGPLSTQLKVSPADLTTLAKKNNGIFPVMHVYEVIDGRQAIPSHGTRDMPIWGNRYTIEQIQTQQALRNRPYYDPEATVRIRILSIIDYLDRIQER